ncbi:hypothetical protein ACQ4PT_069869 [Festuca glaucescens]
MAIMMLKNAMVADAEIVSTHVMVADVVVIIGIVLTRFMVADVVVIIGIIDIVLTHFMVADVVVIIEIVLTHFVVAEVVVIIGIIETMLMHFMVARVVKKKIREIMMTHFMVADIAMTIGIIEKMVTYLTVLHCPECNHCSDRLESFLDLSLEINQMDTLLDSLESFTKTEVVESFICDGCKSRVNMEKHLKVEQAPEVLVIQLKRFENLGSNISKIQEMVKYQLELDLKPFMSSADTNPQKYDLYGVVEHLGNSSKGHYVCYIRSSETDWYLFNDEKVMKLSEDRVLDSKAYLLFYVKQGSSPWFSTLLEEKNALLLGYLQELAEKEDDEMRGSCDSPAGEVRAHYGVETRARKRMRQQSAAGTTAKRRRGGGLKKSLRKKRSVGRPVRGRSKKGRR